MPGATPRSHLLAGCLVAGSLLAPTTSAAAPSPAPWVIPPGREQVIARMVDVSMAGRAPVSDVAPSLRIERDRVRVYPSGRSSLRLVVLPPGARPDEIGDELADGVLVQCGEDTKERCPAQESAPWRSVAQQLALERDRRADEIWLAPAAAGNDTATAADPRPQARRPAPPRSPLRNRSLAALAGLATILAAAGNLGPPRRGWIAPLACVLLLIAACVASSPFLPLHEHNSFLARADCAVDPSCLEDPAGHAWSIVSLDVLGMFLAALPARLSSYGIVSLMWSALTVLFVCAFVRRLCVHLGSSAWADGASAFAGLMLASHPMFWRLSTSGIFWPYAGACTFAAGYFALSAMQSGRPWLIVTNGAAAGLTLAFACASNILLLTLAPLAVLAPACWHEWRGPRPFARAAALAIPALILFAWALAPAWLEGVERAFAGPDSPTSDYSLAEIRHRLAWVLAEPSLSPTILMLPVIASLGLLASPRSALRCAPAVYAGLIPFLLLCVHAGDMFGATYPVQFINHWWSLPFSAAAAGLGVAWALARLDARGWLDRRRLWITGSIFAAITLVSWPFADETWRLLRERRVLERELVAIETALPELPEHDLLLLPPDLLDPLPGAGRQGDPIEVHYPRRVHASAMQARGLNAPRVVQFDELAAYAGDQRILFYLGSALRSFQPHEIAGGYVPDSLERPELAKLRARYELEPVSTFEVAAKQHALVWTRLGADRSPTVELGYYFLRPRPGRRGDASDADPRR